MRVRVLGAGIVGLAIAEELIGRGHDVEAVDPAPGRGASYAAAGMLAPAAELWHGEDALHRFARASAALWPGYAARLGVPLRTGTLLVAADAGDLAEVDRQVALARTHGDEACVLDRAELLRHEPRLGRIVGGALLPGDHSVDPRAVVAALRGRVPVLAAPSDREVGHRAGDRGPARAVPPARPAGARGDPAAARRAGGPADVHAARLGARSARLRGAARER
jgi:glycine oxidase